MKKGVFVGGMVLGTVISALIHLILFRPSIPFPPGPPPEKMERMMFDRLAKELGLNPEQAAFIEPVMRRVNLAMWESRLKNQWLMEGTLDQADEQILPHLTESQRRRLGELRNRMRETLKKEQALLEKRRLELDAQH